MAFTTESKLAYREKHAQINNLPSTLSHPNLENSLTTSDTYLKFAGLEYPIRMNPYKKQIHLSLPDSLLK